MTYPARYEHLKHLASQLSKAAPGPMAGFARLHQSAMLAGSLTTATKELMALAIAVAVRCDGCVAYHVHDALAAGATREQVEETLGVAVLMGGGPAFIYASQALEALDQFSAETSA